MVTSPAPVPASSPATAGLVLTEAQEGLWYAQRRDPANPVFNTGQYLEMRGPIDREAFTQAVNLAMTEAQAISVAIDDGPDGPLARRCSPITLRIIDYSHEPDGAERARADMRADMTTPLDLGRDPLAAQVLYILGDRHALWYQRVHHVVIDGYGTALLTRRIADLYRAFATGSAPATRPFATDDGVRAADAAYRESDQRAQDRVYWHAAFADKPVVAGMVEGAAVSAHHYVTRCLDLPDAFAARLRTLSAKSDLSWPDIVVALVAAYVHRHTGGHEAVVGVPAMLRVGTPSARVPAMVMNVLPIRVAIAEDQPLSEWLSDVASRLREARSHGRYRSEQLRRDLALVGDDRRLHGPLVNVLPFDDTPALPALSTRLEVLGTGPVDDLTISVRGNADAEQLAIEIDANPSLYDEATVAAHAGRLATFLTRAIEAARLADVPTVTPSEHERWIAGVNQTAHPVPETTLTALIEAAMQRAPSRPALAYQGATLSFQELDRVTHEWARRLADWGVGRGAIVAVVLPRSLELEIALVAILRAGAAYLPIDVEYPRQRIATLLEASGAQVVLTFERLMPLVPPAARVVAMDGAHHAPSDRVLEAPVPSDAAYVIFTSGSTGTPKGVVVEHRAIVNRLEWMREHYGFTADDRILQKTPATFDVSVWEFFLPLTTGATLVMAPPEAHKDPAWLARLIREQQITTLHFVPSMMAQFVAEPAARGLTVRRVFCSGEALTAALRDRFHAVVHGALHNLYGPTEAAVDVTYWDASRHDDSAVVPIGWPVWNTQMYILDDRLRPVPAGVTGHLYIAGVQLAREYLGQAALTAERFIPNPYGAPGARMYLTGDLARWRGDGAIEFLGRSDYQVKVRGLRIELGEIESALLSDTAVEHAAVLAREDRPGDQRLVAYVAPRRGHAVDSPALTAMLQARLPVYMVPSIIVVLDRWPLNSSGKLDRKQLPAPNAGAPVAVRPLRTPTEVAVARIFGDVLGETARDRIGADTDFFECGGHSLLAVKAMRLVRQEWDCAFGLGVLFAHSTVEALAAVIDGATGDTAVAGISAEGLGPVIELAAGSAEARLFCIHPAGGIAWCYKALARAVSGAWRVYGMQAPALALDVALPSSMSALAADYAARIRQVQPRGPYHLLGWSVGGIIAHAVAAALEAQADEVATLAMLDAYPSDRWRNQAPPDEGAALRAVLLIAGMDPDSVATGGPLTREGVMTLLRASQHPLGNLSDAALRGVLRIVEHNSTLVREHVHTRVGATAIYFRAALDHAGDDLSPEEWRPYIGALHVHDVASRHAHLTGTAATAAIAPVLLEWQAQEGR